MQLEDSKEQVEIMRKTFAAEMKREVSVLQGQLEAKEALLQETSAALNVGSNPVVARVHVKICLAHLYDWL
eukprot:scaffold336449_cov45-Prasinocladus_malaysianus.AAC.1